MLVGRFFIIVLSAPAGQKECGGQGHGSPTMASSQKNPGRQGMQLSEPGLGWYSPVGQGKARAEPSGQ